jgi:hypothetical protein
MGCGLTLMWSWNISPGAGTEGSFSWRFMRMVDRRRLEGEA